MRGTNTIACEYPSRLPSLPRLFTVVLLAAFLAACAVVPEPLTNDELTQQAKKDIDRLFVDGEPLSETEVLTLPRAIARALKYNLDHRVKMMEEALALDRFDMEKFDLLPRLEAGAKYHGRSEYHASRNVDFVTGKPTDSNPTYSSEKKTNTSDLTLSWNILDFGISYYTAKQNADLALIANERRRKVIHNLIQEIFFSYWRVVAYQELRDEIRETIRLAEEEYANAETEIKEKQTDPLQPLRYQKMLLENISKLDSIEQELSTAYIELAALINVEPGTNIRVAAPEFGNLTPPEWDISLGHMEELAFRNNPDIREKTYQSRIAVKETRKAILGMLPGITLTSANRYDSNDLLEKNHWYEWSTELTWNVFNMLRAPTHIGHAETYEKLAETKRLALRMAVLAQVHVANHQFTDTRKQFQQADRFFEVNRRISDLVATGRIGRQSVRDSVYEKTSEIIAQLQRYQAYAKLQAAYGQLHATVGLDIAPPSIVSSDLRDVTTAVKNRLLAWKHGDLVRQAVAYRAPADRGTIYTVPKAVLAQNITHCTRGWECLSAGKKRLGLTLERKIKRRKLFDRWKTIGSFLVQAFHDKEIRKNQSSLKLTRRLEDKTIDFNGTSAAIVSGYDQQGATGTVTF
uniref:Outer membrane protein TolC n=1 Tax=Candidatus Kentrum sp. DK TaxID=2126562 RepID=A0A450RW18_9GAMM|nr:MAG: Outer membrane protein TolC [Candidatus Kentron sp. DK]